MVVKELLKRIPESATIFRTAVGLRYRRSLRSAGHYRIRPVVDLPPFEMYLDVDSEVDLRKVRGGYEPHVQELLAEVCAPDTVFWEIGAAWGFFSLATAPLVDSVRAFEAVPDRAERLRAAARRNGYENVTAIGGHVGDAVHLDEFSPPDVGLMDVEGAEAELVSAYPSLVSSVPLWIVELHDPGLPRVADTADPAATVVRLEECGFDVRRLGEPRKEGNYHVVAEAT